MDQSIDYNLAWENEEQNLATKSIAKIWLLASVIIPFFAFLEIQNGIKQVLSFLYLAVPLSCLLLFSVAFHKKMKLPPAVLTYSVSVIIALLFSYMACKTYIENVHNYILGISTITLVRGVLYFGKARNLLVVTAINHSIALILMILVREEAITAIPNILSAYLFSIIFILFSCVGMQTRYALTKENFVNSLKLKKSFEEIEEKNKDITDSINYAKRLQEAILPPLRTISEFLPDSFLLYRPKDIIAGDFYWMEYLDDTVFIAAADSTGHGVPGAMVSVVCSNALNRAVKEFGLRETGKILDKTRELVLETFAKSSSQVNDGMDISLLAVNKSMGKIQWSGANNQLLYIENGVVKEINGDKQAIGKTENPGPFTSHTVPYVQDISFYLLTDGYADQFGGPKGKKFMYKRLEKILIAICDKTMTEQNDILAKNFEEWKGGLDQIDDVTIIGIKL